MVLKAGLIKIAHFAHKSGSNCTYGVGETREHLLGKRYLAEWLRTEGKGHFDVEVELEYKVGNRRADVIQIFPTGWMVAHEIQLASITVRDLEERSNDYLNAGCDVIWYLGGSANTPANRRWVQDYQWDVLTLEFWETDENESEVKKFGEVRFHYSAISNVADASALTGETEGAKHINGAEKASAF